MGMKFLNKKGWHTGSLRNIENVWKAEQKHEQEQKKLEELRKQIVEERERAEFRQLQEQAGLVPRQERLDFLYDSGLAVGKSSEGFKSLEAYPKPEESATAVSSSTAEQSSTPGALFAEKPQSANDAWRKLHSDPLLMIRQREQEALARIRNNPVKMAMIRRTVEEESKNKENSRDKKKKKKHGEKKSSHKKHSSRFRHSDDDVDDDVDDNGYSRKGTNTKTKSAKIDYEKPGSGSEEELREGGSGRHIKNDRVSRETDNYDKGSRQYRDVRRGSVSEEDVRKRESRRKNDRGSRREDKYDNLSRHYGDARHGSDLKEDVKTRVERMDDRESRGNHDRDTKQYRDVRLGSDDSWERGHHKDSTKRHGRPDDGETRSSDVKKSIHDKFPSHSRSDYIKLEKESESSHHLPTSNDSSAQGPDRNPQNRRKKAPKLSEEERAARLREMQLDAEVHEEQRWKRLKKAEEDDAREVALAAVAKGKNFLDVAKKNVYGAEQGGSATIEESVRRRSHFLQGRSAADAGNAFRR